MDCILCLKGYYEWKLSGGIGVWRYGGEKERMHGESVGGSIIYDRTSKAKEELKEVHY